MRANSLITYPILLVACFGLIALFVTATSYIQLAFAIFLYPLLVIFTYRIFSHKLRGLPSIKQEKIKTPISEPIDKVNIRKIPSEVVDIDKRVFLKLIGGTGITLFLFSFLSKRAENLFYGNLPSSRISSVDPTGKQNFPAQKQSLDGFRIAESEDDTISFYGFTNNEGGWYVMRLDTVSGSFRYVKGKNDFPTNWNNRENLEYDYFNNVFKK